MLARERDPVSRHLHDRIPSKPRAKMRRNFLEILQDRFRRITVQLHDEALPHAAHEGMRRREAFLQSARRFRAEDRLPDLVRVRVQHDRRRRRPERSRQGQHLVQKGSEENLRSGQLQDGSRA